MRQKLCTVKIDLGKHGRRRLFWTLPGLSLNPPHTVSSSAVSDGCALVEELACMQGAMLGNECISWNSGIEFNTMSRLHYERCFGTDTNPGKPMQLLSRALCSLHGLAGGNKNTSWIATPTPHRSPFFSTLRYLVHQLNSWDAMSLYFNHVRTAVTTWIIIESMVCLPSLMKDTVDAQFQIDPNLFFFASIYVCFLQRCRVEMKG